MEIENIDENEIVLEAALRSYEVENPFGLEFFRDIEGITVEQYREFIKLNLDTIVTEDGLTFNEIFDKEEAIDRGMIDNLSLQFITPLAESQFFDDIINSAIAKYNLCTRLGSLDKDHVINSNSLGISERSNCKKEEYTRKEILQRLHAEYFIFYVSSPQALHIFIDTHTDGRKDLERREYASYSFYILQQVMNYYFTTYKAATVYAGIYNLEIIPFDVTPEIMLALFISAVSEDGPMKNNLIYAYLKTNRKPRRISDLKRAWENNLCKYLGYADVNDIPTHITLSNTLRALELEYLKNLDSGDGKTQVYPLFNLSTLKAIKYYLCMLGIDREEVESIPLKDILDNMLGYSGHRRFDLRFPSENA